MFVEHVKAAWRLALFVGGVKVTLRRTGTGTAATPQFQDVGVRAKYGTAGAAMDLAGGVKVVSHELIVYADDLKNLANGLAAGDRVVFEGRTATIEKADNSSGRIMGVPIIYRATVQT